MIGHGLGRGVAGFVGDRRDLGDGGRTGGARIDSTAMAAKKTPAKKKRAPKTKKASAKPAAAAKKKPAAVAKKKPAAVAKKKPAAVAKKKPAAVAKKKPAAVAKKKPAAAAKKKPAAVAKKKPAPVSSKRPGVAKPAPMVAGASQNDVSPVFAGQEKRLLKLRATDPIASLRARLEILAGRLPESRFAEDFGYLRHVLARGWAVMAIPDDSVIYTLGLHYHFGQPELLIGDQPLADSPELVLELTHVLNEIGARVAGGLRLGPGDTVDVGGRTFEFHAFGDDDFDRYPCGYLATFEEMFEDRFHERGGTLPILRATFA